jgi:hypothetical protein
MGGNIEVFGRRKIENCRRGKSLDNLDNLGRGNRGLY